jgi:hypothetical protein
VSAAIDKIKVRISELACEIDAVSEPKNLRDQAFELRTLATRIEAQAEMIERDLLETGQ